MGLYAMKLFGITTIFQRFVSQMLRNNISAFVIISLFFKRNFNQINMSHLIKSCSNKACSLVAVGSNSGKLVL